MEILISPVAAVLFFTLAGKERTACYVGGGLAMLQAGLFFPLGAFVFGAAALTVLNAGGTGEKTEGGGRPETDRGMALALHTGLLVYGVVFLYEFCESAGLPAVFWTVSVLADYFLEPIWKAPARRCVPCVLLLVILTVWRVT